HWLDSVRLGLIRNVMFPFSCPLIGCLIVSCTSGKLLRTGRFVTRVVQWTAVLDRGTSHGVSEASGLRKRLMNPAKFGGLRRTDERPYARLIFFSNRGTSAFDSILLI